MERSHIPILPAGSRFNGGRCFCCSTRIISGASSSANPSPARSAPALADTVPQQVRDGSATLVGKHTDSDTLVVLFLLPFKDQAGLQAFLDEVNNPSSPNYPEVPYPR